MGRGKQLTSSEKEKITFLREIVPSDIRSSNSANFE